MRGRDHGRMHLLVFVPVQDANKYQRRPIRTTRAYGPSGTSRDIRTVWNRFESGTRQAQGRHKAGTGAHSGAGASWKVSDGGLRRPLAT
jgi:hypothetical protein